MLILALLFHPHKRCLQIGLGIAVPVFPHDLKTFLILHQAAAAFFQFLIEFLDLRLVFPFSGNEYDPFSFCDPHQIPLQVQDLQRGTVIDLNDGIIRDLLMLCDLPFPVFFDDLPDFLHPFDHEHMGIPQIISGSISILMQECIIFCIKGIYRIQQACQMIVERPTPDKSIPVGIRFDLCPINIKLLQGDKAFLFQTAHKLIVQFIQDFPGQLFPFKIVKDIPFWLLAFG